MPKPLSQVLYELRDLANLSAKDLAQLADLNAETVGRIERGEVRRPTKATIHQLARALAPLTISTHAEVCWELAPTRFPKPPHKVDSSPPSSPAHAAHAAP